MSLADIVRERTRGRGQHRAADDNVRLRAELDRERAHTADLQHRLTIATTGWDNANAKVSQLRDELARAVEATRQNQQAVSSLTSHPAVADTQPISVLPLHLSPLAGNTKSRMESK